MRVGNATSRYVLRRIDICRDARYIFGMPTTGMSLKLQRVAANVSQTDLAERMKVSRATVWIIEKAATVSDERSSEYRAALATFENVATTSSGGDEAAA